MAEPRHLANAPITEAIIDLRVRPAPGFQVAHLATAGSLFPEKYPIIETQTVHTQTLLIQPGRNTSSKVTEEQGIRGYNLVSEDRLSRGQFRIDGFTFNRLKPYTSWEEVIEEARSLWEKYLTLAQPIEVLRIGTRYINHITLPLPIEDFAEYLHTTPVLPSEIPQEVLQFLTRVSVYDAEKDITADITQVLEPGLNPEGVTLIFDIDCYSSAQFAPDQAEIWATFDLLRGLKNDVFFRSLTDKTVSWYE